MATNKNTRGNGLNSAQRLTVRIALATGATIVTLLGAQILALQNQTVNAASNESVNVVQQPIGDTSNITDGSDSGNSTGSDLQADPTQIVSQPTAPIQPQPVTRSSRRR